MPFSFPFGALKNRFLKLPSPFEQLIASCIRLSHSDQAGADAKFLTRLSDRKGGEVSIKTGKLFFLKAGVGVTASGSPIPQVTITHRDGDRHQFAIADRGRHFIATQKVPTKKPPAKGGLII